MARRWGKNTLIAVVLLFLAPATASAYTVTVRIHGAGTVSEITNRTGSSRGVTGCTVGPTSFDNSRITTCVMGSESGLWNFGDIVRLGESVNSTASNRGWHFDHWTDSSASGFVNCDPQDATGDFANPNYCEFQVFQNLTVDLWFKDTTGPQDTIINGGPAQGSTTSSTSAQFTSFAAASDPDATFECRLDPPGAIGSFSSCPANGAQFTNLTQNGTWQLTVRAKDPSGNVDTTPASRSWVVDTTPPIVHLTNGPAEGSKTNARSADFTVTTSDGTLVCTLDAAQLSTCSVGSVHLTSLSDGQHTFSVRGVDAVGNSSAPLTRTWTVDATSPTVTVTGGPNGATKDTSATFTVATDEGTLACTLDGAPTACSGAHGGLAEGSHTFTATATDVAGNTSAPVSRTWTVDTTPPTVTISGGPPAATNATTASFTVTTDEGTPTCILDGAAAPCAGPHGGLTDGQHTFTAVAADALGNTSAPVSRRWTVDTVAPDVSLVGGPAAGSTATDGSAVFTFASSDIGATFQCRLDSADFAPCPNPTGLSGLADGSHTFSVRAVDTASNASAPVNRSWTVATPTQQPTLPTPTATPTPTPTGGGTPPPLTPVPGALRYRFATHGARTTIVTLSLNSLTAPRTTVTVACKGDGCRFKSLKATPGSAHTVDLRKLLGTTPLRSGQILTVKVSAPGYLAKAATFTLRRGSQPKGGVFRSA